MAEDKGLTLSATQLQELVAAAVTAAVAEAKKPFITEEQRRAMEGAQQDRAQNAEQMRLQIEQKKAQQKMCSHMRRDGSTKAVYIQNGNYLLCQTCQDVIRPEDRPDLFNRLFQLTENSGIFA